MKPQSRYSGVRGGVESPYINVGGAVNWRDPPACLQAWAALVLLVPRRG